MIVLAIRSRVEGRARCAEGYPSHVSCLKHHERRQQQYRTNFPITPMHAIAGDAILSTSNGLEHCKG
jgi:hypothetical protein